MRGVAVLLVAGACYAPSVPQGAPCASDGTCPEPLVCRDLVCVTATAIDGADHDAIPLEAGVTDRDGDGVPDDQDDCPDVKNSDQENEDGDRFGDACDPCPISVDTNPPDDADGDGVSGICDLHPSDPTDRIVLFEGFTHGVPSVQASGMLASTFRAACSMSSMRLLVGEFADGA